MAKSKGSAVYLEKKNGWFWVVRSGNHIFYYGPYKTETLAKIYEDAREFSDHEKQD